MPTSPRGSLPAPLQPCDEETIEPRLPRRPPRQMARQRAHVAQRRDAFAQASDLARLDRRAANVGVAPQQRRDLALALLGLQRASAIDYRAAGPGLLDRPVEQLGLQFPETRNVAGPLGPCDVGMSSNRAGRAA